MSSAEPLPVDVTDHSPSEIIGDAAMLGRWLRVYDDLGNEHWYRSVEDTVRGRWIVWTPDVDQSHLIDRERVLRRVEQRWPDVSVFEEGPIDEPDD